MIAYSSSRAAGLFLFGLALRSRTLRRMQGLFRRAGDARPDRARRRPPAGATTRRFDHRQGRHAARRLRRRSAAAERIVSRMAASPRSPLAPPRPTSHAYGCVAASLASAARPRGRRRLGAPRRRGPGALDRSRADRLAHDRVAARAIDAASASSRLSHLQLARAAGVALALHGVAGPAPFFSGRRQINH